MDGEFFFTGYCRASDQSRMVAVEIENGALLDADCLYGRCPNEPNCPIAEKIRQLLNG